MVSDKELRGHAPRDLVQARGIAHKAAQLLTRAARANLAPLPDDSQSNLGWDDTGKQFLSQPIGGDFFVGLTLSPLMLSFGHEDGDTETLDLDNVTQGDAEQWLDAQLRQAELNPASDIDLPYDLPVEAAEIEKFSAGENAGALKALSNWFDLAEEAISALAADNATLSPGPSPLRCWPHHFDIATYVGLEAGDAETARAIGVGMSPGDESYDQPYFYVNPWPHLDPLALPEAPAPGHWHTEGFVGLIATAEEVLSQSDNVLDLSRFLENAFEIGRQHLSV